jgi:hypothetical protein
MSDLRYRDIFLPETIGNTSCIGASDGYVRHSGPMQKVRSRMGPARPAAGVNFSPRFTCICMNPSKITLSNKNLISLPLSPCFRYFRHPIRRGFNKVKVGWDG